MLAITAVLPLVCAHQYTRGRLPRVRIDDHSRASPRLYTSTHETSLAASVSAIAAALVSDNVRDIHFPCICISVHTMLARCSAQCGAHIPGNVVYPDFDLQVRDPFQVRMERVHPASGPPEPGTGLRVWFFSFRASVPIPNFGPVLGPNLGSGPDCGNSFACLLTGHPATDTCALYAGEILHADIAISGRSCSIGPGSIPGVVHTSNRCDHPDKLINRWQKKHNSGQTLQSAGPDIRSGLVGEDGYQWSDVHGVGGRHRTV